MTAETPAPEEFGTGAHEVKKPGKPEYHCLANEKPQAALTRNVRGFNTSVVVARGTYSEAIFRLVGMLSLAVCRA